jgi:hypothetical protein
MRIPEVPGSNLFRVNAIQTDVFRGFPLSLQANVLPFKEPRLISRHSVH